MKADLTSPDEHVLNYAKTQIDKEGGMAKQFINYVYADANCALAAFTSTGRFHRFNSEYEFDILPLEIDNSSSISENVYDTIAREMQNLHPGE